jgi:hypothetical protein
MPPQHNADWSFALGGLVLAVLVTLGMGLGLLVASRYPERIERGARVGGRTATVLLGSGMALIHCVIFAVLVNAPARAQVFIAIVWVPVFVFLFVLGFTADALRSGRRISGRDGTPAIVLGWLVRAGAMAIPFVWTLVAAYLVVSALGNPVAALFDGKATTAPSPGSSPER